MVVRLALPNAPTAEQALWRKPGHPPCCTLPISITKRGAPSMGTTPDENFSASQNGDVHDSSYVRVTESRTLITTWCCHSLPALMISRQSVFTHYQMPYRAQLRPKVGIFLIEECHTKGKHTRHRGGDMLEGFVEVSAPDLLLYDIKISFEGLRKYSQLEVFLTVYRDYQNMARL